MHSLIMLQIIMPKLDLALQHERQATKNVQVQDPFLYQYQTK